MAHWCKTVGLLMFWLLVLRVQVGLRFSECLLSTRLMAFEELEFEGKMHTQMLQVVLSNRMVPV